MAEPSTSADAPAPAGRYAPSPSGDLHLGNLRTAAIAWAAARTTGRRFLMRVEDVDTQRSSLESAERQLEDLAALGLDWDGEVAYQHERFGAYESALERLRAAGRVYECYCSRREIREASRAPHVVPGHYPGTCRSISDAARLARRAELAAEGRTPALRLRADTDAWRVHDALAGDYTGEVDDMVLRRGGQQPDWAYNLAVVVDDAWQGVDQVVRGDDLLASAPRQAYLAHLLGLPEVEYVHVPLVLGPDGRRLAKRDGAVTLREMRAAGRTVPEIVGLICASLGYPGVDSLAGLAEVFDLNQLPREPWTWSPDAGA